MNEQMGNNSETGNQPPTDGGGGKRPINFLFDIPIELTVEVGRRSMTMGELVEVMPGTVVELDRPAGDNLDIFANGKLVARGEAVLVGERYGVRIMEVVGEDPFKQTSEEHLIGE